MACPARQSSPQSDTTSFVSTLKSPRVTRFAETNTVHSLLTAAGPAVSYASTTAAQSTSGAIANPDYMLTEQHENKDISVGHEISKSPPISPPLHSALKTPVTAKTVLSPTFRQEKDLEKAELHTERDQAKDFKIKTRVRIAKLLLRGVGLSCALIILSMLTTLFTIFRATRNLPPRYFGSTKLTPWATDQIQWPQITVLSLACFTLFVSVIIFWQYSRGGHRKVEKLQIYYSTFAIGTFLFSIVMWVVGATVLQSSKQNNAGQDMWAWSCSDNIRSKVFGDDIDYRLACRLQDWSLICCVIEVIVDTCLMVVYATVFYRLWTRRKLRKSMLTRDKARSDLYLAQLHHSQPNTPANNGFLATPLNLTDQDVNPPQDNFTAYLHDYPPPPPPPPSSFLHRNNLQVDANTQYATTLSHSKFSSSLTSAHMQKPSFVLQPAPAKLRSQGITPRIHQSSLTPIGSGEGDSNVEAKRDRDMHMRDSSSSSLPPPPIPPSIPPTHSGVSTPSPRTLRTESAPPHPPATSGQEIYASVPVPGAYT